jgi:hypothetical protein
MPAQQSFGPLWTVPRQRHAPRPYCKSVIATGPPEPHAILQLSKHFLGAFHVDGKGVAAREIDLGVAEKVNDGHCPMGANGRTRRGSCRKNHNCFGIPQGRPAIDASGCGTLRIRWRLTPKALTTADSSPPKTPVP